MNAVTEKNTKKKKALIQRYRKVTPQKKTKLLKERCKKTLRKSACEEERESKSYLITEAKRH